MSPAPSPGILIHNVHTNIVGRAAELQFLDEKKFRSKVIPLLDKLQKLSPQNFRRKALIGKWVVEWSGNDSHLDEFFARNWKEASPDDKSVVQCLSYTQVHDDEILKQLRDIATPADLEKNLAQCLKELSNPKFRGLQNDEKIKKIEELSHDEQLQVALRRPFSLYCPQLKTFVTINSNYYGQLKSKSSLGPLEEFLMEAGRLDKKGNLANPEAVWLPMHAACVEMVNHRAEKHGIVLIAPTGTGKSTHAYGLVEARGKNRLHSDDWVFVNCQSREVLISENQFYMRTNIAEIFPHLIPLLVNEPLENVALTEPSIHLLQQFGNPEELAQAIQSGRVSAEDYARLVREMVHTSAARSLIDPRIMVGPKKFVEETFLNFILLLKRDYMDRLVVRALTPDEMQHIMTSKNNVHNYAYGKVDPDGYGIPTEPTTEFYYNPYLCRVEIDPEKGSAGDLDRLRLAAYRTLAQKPEVTVAWLNTRLRASQTQFCLRKFLEGDADEVVVVKGFEADDDILQLLHLHKKEKEPISERRMIDLVGIYSSDGHEVELVSFAKDNVIREWVAFDKMAGGENQIKAYSEGDLKAFFEKNYHVGAKQLFPKQ